ncbi:peroxidase-like [Spodoptera litura]|uniref:Peroxidase-like n=1 Tax=Spodoptera litura TaxID=69820 RepID=A0A9J7IX15_SPOLT|nr:peroxidase-like [Spodoptera litura]
MLFKRIIEGKSMLNADAKNISPEKCSRRRSECDGCSEHSTILEEMMKMVLLGVVLWAGVTFGSHVAPYPLNLILSTDISHPPPMYDYPFPSAEMLRRLPPVTALHTNRSIRISKLEVSMLERLEINLQSAGITPKAGSAALGLAIDGSVSENAMHYEKSSMTITKASQNLVYTRCRRYGLPNDECASFISTLNLRESEFGGECAALERFTCHTNKMSSKYRTFDGSCNNPVRSSWGQALTGYKRLLHPRYADGIEEPRRALSHNALPSPRAVSTKLTSNLDVPNDGKTMALAIWSQFVYHDLVHTPVRKTIHTNQAIRCCGNDGFPLSPRYIHPSCMPISVPHDDPFYKDKYVTCMEYTRSVTTYRGDCTFGAAEQVRNWFIYLFVLNYSNIKVLMSYFMAQLRQQWLGGLDVLAVDIQRGRDHGLPGYIQYRTLCGLPAVSSFQQLSDVMPEETIEKLAKLYEHPGDIDLVIGLMAESPVPGSLLGPTAICIIKEQLWRTKAGDRYFYSHQDEAGKFTKRQLAEIKRSSLARLLCDNTSFDRIQKDAFKPVSESNPIVPCEEIKKVNLEAWQASTEQPDILTRTNNWLKNKVGSSGNSTK